MRKQLIRALGLVSCLATVAAVGVASAANIQSITGQVRPSKLFKKGKFKQVSVFVDLSTTNPSNPYGLPSPTTIAKVDFDKDLRFQQRGLNTCNPNHFTAATTTAQAQNLCHASLVGGGSSRIEISSGPSTPPLIINATVTAFNGAHHTLILFTYNSTTGAQVLIGKLAKDKSAGRKYGTTLTVQVPPLAGGSAVITEFNTRVKKHYRYRGKRRYLVSATCRDKKIHFQARFTYQDGTSAVGRHTQKCRQLSHKHR